MSALASRAAARWRAAASGLAVALGLGATVQAQSLTPETAPAAWVAYAEMVTKTASAWLEEDIEPAARLRLYLDGTRPAADQPTSPLELKLWIDADGAVSRVEFPPLADAAADADLRAVVSQRRLPPPPPKMLQPLRLAVQLEPGEAAAETSLLAGS